MIQELQHIEEKYRKLTLDLSDPGLVSFPQKLRKVAKERSELEPIIKKYEEYKKIVQDLEETKTLVLSKEIDSELRQIAQTELSELEAKRQHLEETLRKMLLPRDPNDSKDVILEIRAGAGGDEASLFAQDLLRMYSRFVEKKGWKVEVVEVSPSPIGGIKEAVVNIKGKDVYSLMKFESGVHRVQRIPKTEASGRIHTSTATVAVLPEADDVEVKIEPRDLKIEAFGSSGPGGQNVNRNYTAIRVTHKPTGIVVSCQDEKSQHRNKEKALKVLRARLLDIAQREHHQEIARSRRSQVGTGERSEKIRTYNFPQSRVTDHRLNESFYNLGSILDGELDDVVNKLVIQRQARDLAVKDANSVK